MRAPYHPVTNDPVKSGVKIVKKYSLKRYLRIKCVNFDVVISQFLFKYQNTAYTTTNKTPAKLLLGRKLRSMFDLMFPDK